MVAVVPLSMTARLLVSRNLPSVSISGCRYASQNNSGGSSFAEQTERQKGKFSPKRARDTSSAQISAKSSAKVGQSSSAGKNSHINKYDTSDTCSLSSVMQTNVPQPYNSKSSKTGSKSDERSGHLSFPGGGWAQTDKYVSADLQSNHHKKLSRSTSVKSSRGSE